MLVEAFPFPAVLYSHTINQNVIVTCSVVRALAIGFVSYGAETSPDFTMIDQHDLTNAVRCCAGMRQADIILISGKTE